jgi:cell shape-determining protein MreC
VRDLQHENQQLKLQMAEMEKALHKAAEYHHAQQVRRLQTITKPPSTHAAHAHCNMAICSLTCFKVASFM